MGVKTTPLGLGLTVPPKNIRGRLAACILSYKLLLFRHSTRDLGFDYDRPHFHPICWGHHIWICAFGIFFAGGISFGLTDTPSTQLMRIIGTFLGATVGLLVWYIGACVFLSSTILPDTDNRFLNQWIGDW